MACMGTLVSSCSCACLWPPQLLPRSYQTGFAPRNIPPPRLVTKTNVLVTKRSACLPPTTPAADPDTVDRLVNRIAQKPEAFEALCLAKVGVLVANTMQTCACSWPPSRAARSCLSACPPAWGPANADHHRHCATGI